jgi:hypothetical protein
LSDGFDLHRCLSLEKGGEEISDFSHDQLNGEINDAHGQSVFCLSIIIIQPKCLKDWPGYCVLLTIRLKKQNLLHKF